MLIKRKFYLFFKCFLIIYSTQLRIVFFNEICYDFKIKEIIHVAIDVKVKNFDKNI